MTPEREAEIRAKLQDDDEKMLAAARERPEQRCGDPVSVRITGGSASLSREGIFCGSEQQYAEMFRSAAGVNAKDPAPIDPPIDPQAYLNQRRAEAAAAAESGRWSVGPPSLDDAIARLMTAVHQMQVAANLVQDIMSAPVAQVVRPPRAVISIAPTPDMGRGRLILGNSAPSAGLPDRRLTVAVQLLPFDGPLVDGSPAGVAQGAVLHAGGAR